MMCARSSDQYEHQRSSLHSLCGRIGFESFNEYMERNWHSCADMWVMYKRARLAHFRTHTNNTLKSFFGKLKHGVDGSASMSRCLEALIAAERRRENEYRHQRLRIGRFVNSNNDEEMAHVLTFTTHYVAAQVEGEYRAAIGDFNSYKIEAGEADIVLVSSSHKTHHVCAKIWSCDCSFASVMKLSCLHAMIARKATGSAGSVIPLVRIDPRRMTMSPVPSMYRT